MNWDSDIYTCPHCGREDLVLASGPKRSPILIVGEFPGKDEIKKGKPMVGAMGGVLRNELARVDLDMNQMRLTNLWLHPQTRNEDCFEYGLEKLIREADKKKAILLLGSDTVSFLCDEKVSEVSSLEVKSIYLSAPLVMACVQPATVFHQSIGELRLALEKFSEKVNKL